MIFFRDYSFLLSDVKKKAKHGEGLKIITPKQRFEKLPIPLEQVKAGDVTENLLNEINKSHILCIKQKKLLKKYTTI